MIARSEQHGTKAGHSDKNANGQSYLPTIIERLKTLDPVKVILFGSYAYGTPDSHSDIDLLVVLNDDTIPQSFQENMKKKLLVRKAIWELSKQISIDLVVHTKPMHQKFQALGSMFAREIEQKGKVLYETDNP